MKLFAKAAILIVLLLPGCGDSPVELEAPAVFEVPDHANRSTVVGDSVYWVGNVSEFPDSEGNYWRWERTGSNGIYPEVRVFKNGTYYARFEIEYNGPQIVRDVMYDIESGGSLERLSDGTITASDPGGHLIWEPESVFWSLDGVDDCGDLITIESSPPGCKTEWQAMHDRSMDAAMVSALGAFVTVWSGGSMAVPAVGAMLVTTGQALGALGRWARCKIAKV